MYLTLSAKKKKKILSIVIQLTFKTTYSCLCMITILIIIVLILDNFIIEDAKKKKLIASLNAYCSNDTKHGSQPGCDLKCNVSFPSETSSLKF